MKKSILAVSVFVGLAFASCGTKTAKNAAEGEAAKPNQSEVAVPFVEARNYFVSNTFREGQLADPKIESEEEFDAVFGMARTMGEGGKPTEIDFSKQYVIAVVGKVSDRSPAMAPVSLRQKKGKIILTYSYKEGEKQSYTSQPSLILIVSKQYQGAVELERK